LLLCFFSFLACEKKRSKLARSLGRDKASVQHYSSNIPSEMPINRRIPPPPQQPPPASIGGNKNNYLSSTPYPHASASAGSANHKRSRNAPPTAAATAASAGVGGSDGTLHSISTSDSNTEMPSLLLTAAGSLYARGAHKLVQTGAERQASAAAAFRAEMRNYSADTRGLVSAQFQVRSSLYWIDLACVRAFRSSVSCARRRRAFFFF
jgi:hypothetical protein